MDVKKDEIPYNDKYNIFYDPDRDLLIDKNEKYSHSYLAEIMRTMYINLKTTTDKLITFKDFIECYKIQSENILDSSDKYYILVEVKYRLKKQVADIIGYEVAFKTDNTILYVNLNNKIIKVKYRRNVCKLWFIAITSKFGKKNKFYLSGYNVVKIAIPDKSLLELFFKNPILEEYDKVKIKRHLVKLLC